jgi:EF hand
LSESAQRDRRRGAIRPATSALALVALGLVAGCQHASAVGPASAAVPAPPGQVVVEERREEIVLADIDGDGCISLAELAREMAWRFAALDADHDDVLTPDELGGQDPARFARLDRDGDGRLTFVEVMQAKEADFAKADKAKTGCVTVVEVLEFDGLGAGK